MEIFLIIWLGLAIITFNVAKDKGLDPIRWAVIGLLLGFFGILLAIIWPKDQEEIDRKKLSSGGAKKCLQCKELIKTDAVICKHCKSPIQI